jgi:hypothetical protein
MCKFCDAFWDWFWDRSDEWERKRSNDSDLVSRESDRNRELIVRAYAISTTDPSAAFRLHLEAAEAGSAWAMERVGTHYQNGMGVAIDLHKALEYYHRAICAGSWMATIYYARLLADEGHHDQSDRVLKDGIASDFVPAYFWLARLRYGRSKTRKVCREVRPMLEYAASQGHPGAQVTLARWMTIGRFGLREIPRGLKSVVRLAVRSGFGDPNSDSPVALT